MCPGQTQFVSKKILTTQKDKAGINYLNSKQKPQNYQQNNGFRLPYRKLQQFSMINCFSSMNKQANSLAKMQVLYENQIKWAYINNFYNQRRQQLIFAAYMMAQNNIKQGRLLQSQQSFSNCFTTQQNFCNNMIHVSKKRYDSYFQPKNKNIRTNEVRGYNNAKFNIDGHNKSSIEEKLNSSTEASQQKQKNPLNTINKASQKTASINNIENMKGIIADISDKNDKSSSDKYTSDIAKKIPSNTKSSDVISINLPETYKPSNYINLHQGSTASTNNQIIVSEKQAELIVNQVKEQMRGRDPENMYIKCPLCEKQIKRFDLSKNC